MPSKLWRAYRRALGIAPSAARHTLRDEPLGAVAAKYGPNGLDARLGPGGLAAKFGDREADRIRRPASARRYPCP